MQVAQWMLQAVVQVLAVLTMNFERTAHCGIITEVHYAAFVSCCCIC
jgi:hypothetical protein